MYMKTLITGGAGSLSEGCTDLLSSLEGVRMTAEGVFIIEEPGPADPAVSLYSCVSPQCRLFLRLVVRL